MNRQQGQTAKVLIASADVQSSTRVMAEQAGAFGFINKPFSASQIASAVESALRGKHEPE